MSDELQSRRGGRYTRSQLESSGLAIFDAHASPESELHGEKIVRVRVPTSRATGKKDGMVPPRRDGSSVLPPPSPSSSSSSSSTSFGPKDRRPLREKFKRGDVLLLTPRSSFRGKEVPPREGLVTDVGSDYLTLGVGSTWPSGLMEMRKHVHGYPVRLDRVSSTVPLRAQRLALDKLGKDGGGERGEVARGPVLRRWWWCE